MQADERYQFEGYPLTAAALRTLILERWSGHVEMRRTIADDCLAHHLERGGLLETTDGGLTSTFSSNAKRLHKTVVRGAFEILEQRGEAHRGDRHGEWRIFPSNKDVHKHENRQTTNQGDLESIQSDLRSFAQERDWEKFHTPRSLLLALVGEVGELAEQMQWASDDEILARMKTEAGPIEEEVADVAIYLLRLSDVLGVDLFQAIEKKMEANRARYDSGRFQGSSEKAPHLIQDNEDREDGMRKRGDR
jgi:dCTP diphosphatase